MVSFLCCDYSKEQVQKEEKQKVTNNEAMGNRDGDDGVRPAKESVPDKTPQPPPLIHADENALSSKESTLYFL